MSVSNLADSGRSTISTHQFRIQHTNTVNPLLIKRYALLQSADFLFMLFAVPKISETFLQLGDVHYDCTNLMVSEICLTQQHIASAIKAMKSRKVVDEEEAEDDKNANKSPVIRDF